MNQWHSPSVKKTRQHAELKNGYCISAGHSCFTLVLLSELTEKKICLKLSRVLKLTALSTIHSECVRDELD